MVAPHMGLRRTVQRKWELLIAHVQAWWFCMWNLWRGWCVYVERMRVVPTRENPYPPFETTFIGCCTGSLHTHNLLIVKKLWGKIRYGADATTGQVIQAES